MSYVRNCKKCGQRISLRQMPGGHWVAFEVRSDMPHECFKGNSKTNNFSKEERKMEVYETREIIKQAISSKKAIKIFYQDKKGDLTNREIFPIDVEQEGDIRKLSAYCTLRNAKRVFIVENIFSARTQGPLPEWFQNSYIASTQKEKNSFSNATEFNTNHHKDSAQAISKNKDYKSNVLKTEKQNEDFYIPFSTLFWVFLGLMLIYAFFD